MTYLFEKYFNSKLNGVDKFILKGHNEAMDKARELFDDNQALTSIKLKDKDNVEILTLER